MKRTRVEKKDKSVYSSQPIESMSLLKAFQTHDRLINHNLSLTKDLVDSIQAIQRNMKGMNDIIKGMLSCMGELTGVLRTIVDELPK